MERDHQHITIIDLEDRGVRRSGIVIAIIAVLLAAIVVVPAVIDDRIAPATEQPVSLQAGEPAPPTLCNRAIDVPQMLDPLARFVLPGWTRLCGWLSEADIAEPLDPSG